MTQDVKVSVADSSREVERPRRRVLVLLNQLSLGGTQLNALDFAGAVRRYGYDSILVAEQDPRSPDQPMVQLAADRGFPITVLPVVSSTARRAVLLDRLARSHGCQLVHTYGWWSAPASFWGPAKFGRMPLVMTAYEMSVQATIFPSIPLVVGTQYQVEDLASRPGPVHYISPPVDLALDNQRAVDSASFVDQLGLNPGHLRVVIVSRLAEEMKACGIEVAIRALEALSRPDVDLVIVGTGDAETRLRMLATEVNVRLGRRAVVLPCAMSDPRPAYACADIVLGMGGSAARAMAFAKPLIALGEQGWSSMFTPRSTAAIFRNSFWSDDRPASPIELLVEQLQVLLDDGRHRRDLGAFGRTFAETNFGLGEMAAKLAAVYDSALSERRLGPWIKDAVGYADGPRMRSFVRRRLPGGAVLGADPQLPRPADQQDVSRKGGAP